MSPSLVDDVAADQTFLFDHHAVAPTVAAMSHRSAIGGP
jgi:hypothetical protein